MKENTLIEFVVKRKKLSELILNDDSSDNWSRVSEIIEQIKKRKSLTQLFPSNICLIKYELTPEEYEQLAREEDLMLEHYRKPVFE